MFAELRPDDENCEKLADQALKLLCLSGLKSQWRFLFKHFDLTTERKSIVWLVLCTGRVRDASLFQRGDAKIQLVA
jgi:hypothetical protein